MAWGHIMDSPGLGASQLRAALAAAVHRNDALSSEGMLESLFTLLFNGLVYPQIWEDPVVDTGNFGKIRDCADRVEVHQISMTPLPERRAGREPRLLCAP